jgi:hypothetical protein
MTQNFDDDEEYSPGKPKQTGFEDSAANGDYSVIIANNDQQQLQQPPPSPWSDIHAFIEQSRAEQHALLDRIENLEATQKVEDTVEENDEPAAPLEKDIGEIDDNKEEGDNSLNLRRSTLIRRKAKPWKYQKFPLPESTYTLLITERILSMPFVVGIIAVVVPLMCLSITLKNELGNKKDGNPYGLPAGVPTEVRIAQFLGIIIGKY